MDQLTIITITSCVLIFFGFVSMGVGLVILMREVLSRKIKDIKDEISSLATKGLLSGLQESLESAIFLMKELNALMKTEIGAGLSLLVIGILLILAGVLLLGKFAFPGGTL